MHGETHCQGLKFRELGGSGLERKFLGKDAFLEKRINYYVVSKFNKFVVVSLINFIYVYDSKRKKNVHGAQNIF